VESLLELDSQLRDSAFSGQIMAAHNGEMIYRESYGLANREKATKFNDQTVVDLGSITKQFVATAIIQLEEQGKLSVNDSIELYFPDLPEDKQGITLHHLLTHTSGLPSNIGFIYDKFEPIQLLEGAFPAKLEAMPGEQYAYSNVGYSLLALVIERVSGIGYEEYIRNNILTPAGLSETGYRLVVRDEENLAVNYGRDPNFFQSLFAMTAKSRSVGHSLQHLYDEPGPRWNMEGAGGLLSTTDDIYRWYLAIRSSEILSAEGWKKLFTPYVQEIEGSKFYYGYGWVVDVGPNEHKRLWHNGSNGYNFSVLHYYPDLDLMLFYTTNNRDDNPAQLMEKLESIFIKKLELQDPKVSIVGNV
jgi:CubicO group peptidase (beta-lactamase class C family)